MASFAAFRARLGAVDAAGFSWWDLSDVFAGREEELFLDNYHFGDRGNESGFSGARYSDDDAIARHRSEPREVVVACEQARSGQVASNRRDSRQRWGIAAEA